MKQAWWGAIVLGLGCSAEEQPITPTPDVTASSASSSTSAGGAGGAGGSSSSAGGGGASSIGWQSGSRLRARTFDGEDGSREFREWFDSDRQESCAFGVATDGEWACLPTARLPMLSYYSDPTCTVKLATSTSGPCASGAPPDYAAELLPDCPARTRIYELGAEYVGQLYLQAGSCVAQPNPQGFVHYNVGPIVQPVEFAHANLVTE